jgi:hypothetical protein
MPNSPEIQFAKEALRRSEEECLFLTIIALAVVVKKRHGNEINYFFMHSRKNSLNAHKMTLTWSQSTAK